VLERRTKEVVNATSKIYSVLVGEVGSLLERLGLKSVDSCGVRSICKFKMMFVFAKLKNKRKKSVWIFMCSENSRFDIPKECGPVNKSIFPVSGEKLKIPLPVLFVPYAITIYRNLWISDYGTLIRLLLVPSTPHGYAFCLLVTPHPP